MSYQVLARAYRPQDFASVIGQDHIVQTLTNIIKSKRIGHAYLFSGTRGVGKTSVARIFAKALNCETPKGVEPCNECSSCKDITHSSSMDVIEIDGASNNGVAAIRELRDQIAYLPASSKYKIYIIDEVHMLSESAFNALLKTLEEPPEHSIFIFATTELYDLPATILSRCQKFSFRKVSLIEISSHLKIICEKNSIEISDAASAILAREARGSFRDALSLLDQVISFAGNKIDEKAIANSIGLIDYKIINTTLFNIFTNNAEGIIDLMKAFSNYGCDFKTYLISLTEAIRNLLILKIYESKKSINETALKELLDLPDNEIMELKDLAFKIKNENNIYRIFNIISEATPLIISSLTPSIALEMTLLRASHNSQNTVPIKNIMEKLELYLKNEPNKVVANKNQVISNAPGRTVEDTIIKKPTTINTTNELNWEQTVKFIKSKKPLLATNLEEATLISLTKTEANLAFANESFAYKQLTDQDNKNDLEKLLSNYYQTDFKVKIIISQNDLGTGINLKQIKETKIEKSKQDREKLATSHPSINNIKNILQGEIINVTIEDEEN